MPKDLTLTMATLRTPKAAAVAGILFSVLLVVAFVLLRISVPADPLEPGAWLRTSSGPIVIALNIIPFAGIAFLWFIGVLRDRLGQREDRFFATVFFGSGLLFLAMLFVASAMVGALILVFAEQPDELVNVAAFHFARATIYSLINIWAPRKIDFSPNRGACQRERLRIGTGTKPNHLEAILWYAIGECYFSRCPSI
jgi:hypothetical protein